MTIEPRPNPPRVAGDRAIGRPPQQGRSRASFERMLQAAEALLLEHGSDSFTLTDVSRVGKVSIGSIYNRFASKDELIHALHARIMERLEAEQALVVMRARSRSNGPVAMVRAVMEEVGEFLFANAAIMRPMMLRAAFDIAVQNRGRVAHVRLMDSLVAELLGYRAMIRHADPEHAIRSALGIAYAAFARELGFGMAEAPQDAADWAQLKQDIGEMAARYLFGTIDPLD